MGIVIPHHANELAAALHRGPEMPEEEDWVTYLSMLEDDIRAIEDADAGSTAPLVWSYGGGVLTSAGPQFPIVVSGNITLLVARLTVAGTAGTTEVQWSDGAVVIGSVALGAGAAVGSTSVSSPVVALTGYLQPTIVSAGTGAFDLVALAVY